MKKKIVSFIMAVMLIATMVVPALAAKGDGTYAGHYFEYSTKVLSSSETGMFSYDQKATVVGRLTADLWCSAHTDHYYVYDTTTRSELSSNGKMIASCEVSNYVSNKDENNPVYHYCVFQNGTFTGWVNSHQIFTTSY